MTTGLRGAVALALSFSLAFSPLAPVRGALALGEEDETVAFSPEREGDDLDVANPGDDPEVADPGDDERAQPADGGGAPEGAADTDGADEGEGAGQPAAEPAAPEGEGDAQASDGQALGAMAEAGISDWASLQAALNAGGTVTLTQDISAIRGDVSLTVPSGITVELDLNGKTIGSLQALGDNAQYAIRNEGTLTVTDGMGGGKIADSYGGIYNTGNLTITGGAITNNYSLKNGGGIYNAGSLSISGGEISNNTAEDNGGGIYNEGDLTITGGSIVGNWAKDNGSGIFNNGSMSVSGTPVVKSSNGNGGNVYLPASHPTITVTGALEGGATIGVTLEKEIGAFTSGYSKHNSANPNDYFHADNGDLSIILLGGEVSLSRAVTSWAALQEAINNSTGETLISLGATLKAASNESAIRIPSGKNIVLDLCGHDLDRGLTKEGSAGHVIQMKGSGKLTIQSSVGGQGKITGGWSEHGGGINIEPDSTCIIESGKIEGNSAEYGGGIWNSGTLTIKGGTISGNSASKQGGGINSEGSATVMGGTISGNNAPKGGGVYSQGTTKFSDCAVKDNTAEYGAGIYFDKKPNEQSMSNVVLTGNVASTDGGGFYLQTGTVTLTGGEITNNKAKKDGGGAFITNNTTLEANGTTFKSNQVKDETFDFSSPAYSGGAFVNHGTVTLEDCLVESNRADLDGGAIWSDGTLTLITSTISKNLLWNGKGGGIYIKGGTAQMSGCTISENTNGTQSRLEHECLGGGIANEGTLTATNCRIDGNSSYNSGGGIYNTGTLNLERMSYHYITNNTAQTGQGGGIFVNKGTANVDFATMTGNKAKTTGGAISCTKDGKVNFGNWNSITNNQTSSGDDSGGEGGGVYMAGTMSVNGTLTIEDNLGAYAGWDLYLVNGKKINVKSIRYSHIGVGNPTGTGVITSGYSDTTASVTDWFFVSGPMSEYCSVRENKSRQAELFISEADVSYYDPTKDKTESMSINDVKLINSGTTELKSGWYYLIGDASVSAQITVNGKANIILKDGTTLNTLGGIVVESGDQLTIWGQEEGTGTLRVFDT